MYLQDFRVFCQALFSRKFIFVSSFLPRHMYNTFRVDYFQAYNRFPTVLAKLVAFDAAIRRDFVFIYVQRQARRHFVTVHTRLLTDSPNRYRVA